MAADGTRRSVVAIVGCSHIHTPGFVKTLVRLSAQVRVKWVWDPVAARASHWASACGAVVAPDAAAVWSDPEVDGVVICSETTRHKDLVLAAAAAGKHLYVEKPLGSSAAESEEMAAAVSKAGVLFTTGYFMRTSPAHRFLKAEIEAGAFGTVTRLVGSNCHAGSLSGWFDAHPESPWEDFRWMADPKIAGVGAFGDLGTHMLDIMMWLCGPVEAIAAQTRVVTGRYGDCDESGEALMRFRSGATGGLSAGWVDLADPVTLEVSGTKAHAVIVRGELFYTNPDKGSDGKKPWTQLPGELPRPLDLFVRALGGSRSEPLVPVAEAAQRVRVMEAAYRSVRSGRFETV
jgi:predicted dehydrogenase